MPKGICEIILQENGKEVLHTRDENMVTNAIANLLNPPASFFYVQNGYYDYCDYGKTIVEKTPIATKLLGGVLLFQNQITENADTIYPPADNPQIGYAGNDAYSGTNTLRGSYSTPESQALSNGYKHVWNFSEAQANGTIRCVSLTSPQGGKGGWNSVSDVQNSFIANFSPVLTGSESDRKRMKTIGGLIGNYAKNVFTGISINDKTVTFTDYTMADNVKLNDDLSNPSSASTSITSNLLLNSFSASWFASEDFCSSAYNSSESNTIQYVKFKGSDKSILSEQTITVPGGDFYFSSYNAGCHYGEKDGYLYIRDYVTKNKVWKINLSNTADITSLTLPEAITYLSVFKSPNGLIFFNLARRNAYLLVSSTFNLVGIPAVGSDGSLIKLIPSNFIPKPYVIIKSQPYNQAETTLVSIIAPYLATIDNLASSVTKTANQTMKVIYTITNS